MSFDLRTPEGKLKHRAAQYDMFEGGAELSSASPYYFGHFYCCGGCCHGGNSDVEAAILFVIMVVIAFTFAFKACSNLVDACENLAQTRLVLEDSQAEKSVKDLAKHMLAVDKEIVKRQAISFVWKAALTVGLLMFGAAIAFPAVIPSLIATIAIVVIAASIVIGIGSFIYSQSLADSNPEQRRILMEKVGVPIYRSLVD